MVQVKGDLKHITQRLNKRYSWDEMPYKTALNDLRNICGFVFIIMCWTLAQ